MATDATTTLQPPVSNANAGDTEPQGVATILQLYSRIAGKKFLFAAPGSDRARYFVTNPIPHKHASNWRPVFYRGDNPKYSPGTIANGRATRNALWMSFDIWVGDGVHEVLENKRRREFKKKTKRVDSAKGFFRMKRKPPKGPVEDEQEVQGKVVPLKMKRLGLNRSLEFEFEGVSYRWSPTRMLAKKGLKRVKGWSHNFKLVRISDHALVATFKKDRWASYRSSQKTGGPPNKNRSLIGELRIYDLPDTVQHASVDPQADKKASEVGRAAARVDDLATGKGKEDKVVNLSGTHGGDLREEVIVLTSWMAIEGEHRLRYKVLDLLQEIGEEAGG